MSNPVVLLLEDDENMHDALSDTLEDEGFEVIGAYSGEEAIQLAMGRDLDLMVTDVRLSGMDGIETLRLIRETHPNLRAIVITGYASKDSPARAIRLKVADYLIKPFGLDDFAEVVRRTRDAGKPNNLYRRLKQKVFSALGGRSDEVVTELMEDRESLFHSFYVGVRSGLLNEAAALALFRRLEEVEDPYREFLREGTGNLKELKMEYHSIAEFLISFANDNTFEPAAGLQELAVSKEEFAGLYRSIQKGHVDADQLMYAPMLRSGYPGFLDRFPELEELRQQLWVDTHPKVHNVPD